MYRVERWWCERRGEPVFVSRYSSLSASKWSARTICSPMRAGDRTVVTDAIGRPLSMLATVGLPGTRKSVLMEMEYELVPEGDGCPACGEVREEMLDLNDRNAECCSCGVRYTVGV